MAKILYFFKPECILIHETKLYYYFASYGITRSQHLQNKKFLINKYNKSAALFEPTPTFPGKKVNEWIENLGRENREKYKIIVIDKRWS